MYIAENGQYAKLYIEESAYSGVKKIASKVAEDLKKVTDHEFTVEYGLPKDNKCHCNCNSGEKCLS